MPKRLQIWLRRRAAVCCPVSHVANFPRPNLDLPRGFSCYWRDAAGFMPATPQPISAMTTTYRIKYEA